MRMECLNTGEVYSYYKLYEEVSSPLSISEKVKKFKIPIQEQEIGFREKVRGWTCRQSLSVWVAIDYFLESLYFVKIKV